MHKMEIIQISLNGLFSLTDYMAFVHLWNSLKTGPMGEAPPDWRNMVDCPYGLSPLVEFYMYLLN